MPSVARPRLLRDLLSIEIEHRRDPDGSPVDEQSILKAHPHLQPEIVRAVQELCAVASSRSASDYLQVGYSGMNHMGEESPQMSVLFGSGTGPIYLGQFLSER